MPRLRVEVRESGGSAPVDAGPLVDIQDAQYTMALGQIGSFALRVPAEAERSSILTQGREVYIYREGEGHVFTGIIDRVTTTVSEDGSLLREVSGSSLARELVWDNTLLGQELDNASLSSAVTTLLSGSGWSSGTLGSPSTNVTARFDGASTWSALRKVADVFDLLLREDPLNSEIDIAAFGTNPNGIVLRNVENVSPNLADNTNLAPIAGIRVIEESAEVWNKVVPLGQRTGISGENFNLAEATRSSPYTVQSAAGPDGNTYYYLEDSTSSSTYGTRTKVLQFKDVLPLGIGATDFERAANALYDEAVTWLERHKDPQEAYEVSVVGLRHLDDSGNPLFQPGDKLTVQYQGIAIDESGRRRWLDVDEDLYLMKFTRTLSDSGDRWTVQVAKVARELTDDANVTAQILNEIHALEAAPLPYVFFGDGFMRIDPVSVQLAGNTGVRPSLAFVPSFAESEAALSTTYPRMELGGVMNPVASPHQFNIAHHDHDTDNTEYGIAWMSYAGSGSAADGAIRHYGPVASMESLFGLTSAPQGQSFLAQGIDANGEVTIRPHPYNDIAADASSTLLTLSFPSSVGSSWREGAIVILGAPGNAYTVAEGGNIALTAGSVAMSGNKKLMLRYDAANSEWVEIAQSGGGGMSLIVKSADESVSSSTTLQDDDELTFAVGANEEWQFEGLLIVTGDGSGDLKMTFDGPSGSVGAFFVQGLDGLGNDAVHVEELSTTTAIDVVSDAIAMRFWGGVATGGSSGNLVMRWAQDSSNATATVVHAGSYIKYQAAS